MHLYVIRHAIAGDGAADAELTLEGRELFALGVHGLRRLGVRFDRVLHSPLVRARETAELLDPLLDGERAPVEALAHEPTDELLASIRGSRVALVGHEPWQSELVAWLLLGDRALGSRLELEKGAVALLEGELGPGSMRLRGFWRPQVLQALGEV